jgi:hypothetical protein
MNIVLNVDGTNVKVQGPANLLDLSSFDLSSNGVIITLPDSIPDAPVTVTEQVPVDGLYRVVLTKRPESGTPYNSWNKINAIKSLRTWTGQGLKDCKDAVEAPLPALIWTTPNKEAAEALAREVTETGSDGGVEAVVSLTNPPTATTPEPQPQLPKYVGPFTVRVRDGGPVEDTVFTQQFDSQAEALGAYKMLVTLGHSGHLSGSFMSQTGRDYSLWRIELEAASHNVGYTDTIESESF